VTEWFGGWDADDDERQRVDELL